MEGVTCTHSGIKNHTIAQCWSLHEELRPPRPERVNMANVRDNNVAANRRWEAEQLAWEEKSRQYKKERDERERRRSDDNNDDENSPRYQFMVYTQYLRSRDAENDHTLEDPAEEAERELQHNDRTKP